MRNLNPFSKLLFAKYINNGSSYLPITDKRMTRFWITINQGINLVHKAFLNMRGGEIFVPKLRSYSILDVKQAITELLGDYGEEIIGIRSGEKLHETLINNDEIRDGWEIDNMYMISNPIFPDDVIKTKYPGIKHVENIGEYSSDQVEKIPHDELKDTIQKLNII